MVKKTGVVNSNAVGSMTSLTKNISSLLEISFEEQGIPHITAETSGNGAVQASVT